MHRIIIIINSCFPVSLKKDNSWNKYISKIDNGKKIASGSYFYYFCSRLDIWIMGMIFIPLFEGEYAK